MSSRNLNFIPWGNNFNQDQDQDQDQEQYQEQDQDQDQSQDQSQSSENANFNANGNLNGSLNLNGNANGNLNHNSNSSENSNTSTTTVEVVVDVDASASAGPPSDDDFADFDLGCTTIDNILMSDGGDVNYDPGNEMNLDDILDGALNGKGNDVGTVNAQFNNLEDNDVLHKATVGGSLTQTNDSAGGSATTGDGISAGGMADGYGPDSASGAGAWGSGNGDDGSVEGSAAASAASTIDTTAFNQNIVMGANVMGNTVDMTVVGGSLTSSLVGDDAVEG